MLSPTESHQSLIESVVPPMIIPNSNLATRISLLILTIIIDLIAYFYYLHNISTKGYDIYWCFLVLITLLSLSHLFLFYIINPTKTNIHDAAILSGSLFYSNFLAMFLYVFLWSQLYFRVGWGISYFWLGINLMLYGIVVFRAVHVLKNSRRAGSLPRNIVYDDKYKIYYVFCVITSFLPVVIVWGYLIFSSICFSIF